MANTVHAFLKFEGQDIQGESTIKSMERENSIECLSFKDAVRTAREASSGMASGERTYDPIVVRKRLDKSTPLIARALCNNETVEGKFKFYRPNPEGDGTTEQFFTVEIGEARVAFVNRVSPDVSDPANATDSPYEDIGFVFGRIVWTYESAGVEHEDSWSQRT